jgi:hypothetical protein
VGSAETVLTLAPAICKGDGRMGNFADLIVLVIFLVFFAACWGLVKFLDRV